MTETTQSDQGQAELQRLYTLFVEIFRGGLAGTLAGIIFLGIGARIAMRISALLNPEARGAITDNENIVGEITLGGSLELLIFIGLSGGLLVGMVWVVVREWLPAQGFARSSMAAIVSACTGSFAVVAARNEDFQILDPPELHVAMFVTLVGLTGFGTATFDRLLDGRLPTSPATAAVFGGMIGLGLIFTLPLLVGTFIVNHENLRPPWPAALALVFVTIATVTTWVRYYSQGDNALLTMPSWQQPLGIGGVILFTLLGAVHLVLEIDAIV